MTIRALIFDFDGLILETEAPEYDAWVEIFQEYACDLPISEWVKCVGTDFTAFDPMQYLAEKTGQRLDLDALHARQRVRARVLVNAQPVLPGIAELLRDARAAGLKLAVASSGRQTWVHGNLERLGLINYFDAICTAEQVQKVKPQPDLYLCALAALGIAAENAIAFEDSLNGLTAAHAAGLFCVVVPNRITSGLAFGNAGLVLPTLADYPLQKLLRLVEAAHKN